MVARPQSWLAKGVVVPADVPVGVWEGRGDAGYLEQNYIP